MGGIVPATYYSDAPSNVIEDVPSHADSVLQSIFASDHFGPKGILQNGFMLVSGKNGTSSFIGIAKVLLLFRLSCPTYEKMSSSFLVHRMHNATL